MFSCGWSICLLLLMYWDCTRSEVGPSFISVSGACIAGHNNMVLDGLTVQECLSRCLQETSLCCRSLDYKRETGSCQLSVDWQGSTELSNPCHLKGYDYYERVNKECTATGLESGQAALGIRNIIPFEWKVGGQEYPEIKAASGANIACGPGGLQLYVNVAEFEGPVLEECPLIGVTTGTDSNICKFSCKCNRPGSCHTLYTTEPRAEP